MRSKERSRVRRSTKALSNFLNKIKRDKHNQAKFRFYDGFFRNNVMMILRIIDFFLSKEYVLFLIR